jgi:hypothetical protein
MNQPEQHQCRPYEIEMIAMFNEEANKPFFDNDEELMKVLEFFDNNCRLKRRKDFNIVTSFQTRI